MPLRRRKTTNQMPPKITCCEFCKIIGYRMSTRYHYHHLNCKGTGDTVVLCSWHHNNLHGFIKKRAVEVCEINNKEFITNTTEEYKKNLSELRRVFDKGAMAYGNT